MPIENIENINLELLETYGIRPLREIVLHTAGVNSLSPEALQIALSKLKDIDDELLRRRS